VSVLRATIVVAVVVYVTIALGVALQRYMGIAPRKPHFRDPEDDHES
jgi:hypothetical protein